MKLTPELQAAIQAAIEAGGACSNVCFNLAQRSTMPERDQKTCKEAFEQWDAKLTALKVELKKGQS